MLMMLSFSAQSWTCWLKPLPFSVKKLHRLDSPFETKTKIQCLSDFLPPLLPNINIGTEEVEAATNFIYLGSKISSDCTSEPEIIRQLQLMHSPFG